MTFTERKKPMSIPWARGPLLVGSRFRGGIKIPGQMKLVNPSAKGKMGSGIVAEERRNRPRKKGTLRDSKRLIEHASPQISGISLTAASSLFEKLPGGNSPVPLPVEGKCPIARDVDSRGTESTGNSRAYQGRRKERLCL